MASQAAGLFLRDMLSTYMSGKTVKAMLAGSGYLFDPDTHQFRSDVTSEVSGTGYTAGGITLTGVTVLALDTANNRVKLDADDAAFGTLTVSGITQIITYISTGTATTDRIIGVHTFASQSPNAVPFTYSWSADGLGYLSY